MNNKKVKLIIGILGTIILGAIGSGLWDLALEPALTWCGRTFFTIATLGLSQLRNEIYIDIAKGFHEALSILLVIFFFINTLIFHFNDYWNVNGKTDISKSI